MSSFYDLAQQITEQKTDEASLAQNLSNADMFSFQDGDGTTLLMIAAQSGNVAAVKALLARGYLNAVNKYGTTALERAIAHNHIEVVRLLIAAGCTFEKEFFHRGGIYNGPHVLSPSVDSMNHSSGESVAIIALFQAAELGYTPIVKLLIDSGANIKTTSPSGKTSAFTIAAGKGDQATLEILINAWTGLESITPYLESAYRVAAKNGHINLLTFLSKKNIDVNAKDKEGYSALMIAAALGKNDVVTALLPTASAENKNSAYVHASKYAFKHDSFDTVNLFTGDHKASINSIDQFGDTVLMAAVNKPDILQPMLAAKRKIPIAIDYQNPKKNNTTALMLAIKENNLESVNLLLGAGADPSLKDANGNHALRMIVPHNIPMFQAVLSKLDSDKHKDMLDDTLRALARKQTSTPELFDLLIKKGANINGVDENNNTPLMLAVTNNQWNNINTLINIKDIDIHYKNEEGSAFILAAHLGQLQTLSLFLEKCPPTDPQDYYDAFFALFYNNTNAAQKETMSVLLLQNYIKYKKELTANDITKLEPMMGQALLNKQFILFEDLLKLQTQQSEFDLMPLLQLAASPEYEPAFKLLLKTFLDAQQDKPIDFTPLIELAIQAQSKTGLILLMDAVIKSGTPIPEQLRLQFGDEDDITVTQDIAHRYLQHLLTLCADNTSGRLISSANPYKALILAEVKTQHTMQLENSIAKKGINYAHGLSKFLHNSPSWFYTDTSVDEIKGEIAKRKEKSLHNKTYDTKL
jgi:ankyrin repeat protein